MLGWVDGRDLPSTTPPFQITKPVKDDSNARYGHRRVTTNTGLHTAAMAMLMRHKAQSVYLSRMA